MNTKDNRQNAHDIIDHVFQDLLPARGLSERPGQLALSHRMLDALLDRSIALCDAGTGTGKTYAYLAAGAAFHRFCASQGRPTLSGVLEADGLIAQPLSAVVRKGKSHYVCDWRLERRLGQLDLSKKNWKAGRALLSLRERLDLDGAAHLSGYDRERVCVPRTCGCKRDTCRYLAFLEDCETGAYSFQICNHNLLLADAIHRGTGRRPILPDACAVVIDEAHKLPETARQMFGTTLEAGDIRGLIQSLRRKKFVLAAESLAELSAPLLRLMEQPYDTEKSFQDFARLLTAPARNLHIVQKQLHGLLSKPTNRQLRKLSSP